MSDFDEKLTTHTAIITTVYPYKFLNMLYENLNKMEIQFNEIIIIAMGESPPSINVNKRTKILYFEKIFPPGKARNIGILNSSSDYLHFIDDDDLISISRIKIFNKILKIKEHIDVYYDNIVEFSNGDQYIPYAIGCDFSIKKLNYLSLNKFFLMKYGFLKPIVKREFLLKNKIFFNSFLKRGEDLLFRVKLFFFSNKIIITPDVGYYYRIRKESLSGLNSLHQIKANKLVKLYLLKYKKYYSLFIFILTSNNYFFKFLFTPSLLLKKLMWKLIRKCDDIEWR